MCSTVFPARFANYVYCYTYTFFLLHVAVRCFNQAIRTRIATARDKAVAYLKQQLPQITDDYILAMTAYALTLARDSDGDTAFTRLLGDAVTKGKDKQAELPWINPQRVMTYRSQQQAITSSL
jgi:hypothetical protein